MNSQYLKLLLPLNNNLFNNKDQLLNSLKSDSSLLMANTWLLEFLYNKHPNNNNKFIFLNNNLMLRDSLRFIDLLFFSNNNLLLLLNWTIPEEAILTKARMNFYLLDNLLLDNITILLIEINEKKQLFFLSFYKYNLKNIFKSKKKKKIYYY